MGDLMASISNVSVLLHGEYGGLVLIILFLGTLCCLVNLMIVVVGLVRLLSYIFGLFSSVMLRYRNKKTH